MGTSTTLRGLTLTITCLCGCKSVAVEEDAEIELTTVMSEDETMFERCIITFDRPLHDLPPCATAVKVRGVMPEGIIGIPWLTLTENLWSWKTNADSDGNHYAMKALP